MICRPASGCSFGIRPSQLGAILTLGVGIGLSTTVFCVVNAGLFKGLPLPNADRIVSVFSSNAAQGQPQLPIAVHDLVIHQARQTSFDAIGPYASAPFNLSLEEGRPERFQGGQLSLDAFKALGVQPILGRGFQAGDDQPGAAAVVLLGHDLWRERYRRRHGHCRQDDPRQRHAAHRHRCDAADVCVSDSRSALGAAARGSAGDRARTGTAISRRRPAQAGRLGATGDRAADHHCRPDRAGVSRDQSRHRCRRDPLYRVAVQARKSTRCSSRCSAPASACC